jgi:hypothetical protein
MILNPSAKSRRIFYAAGCQPELVEGGLSKKAYRFRQHFDMLSTTLQLFRLRRIQTLIARELFIILTTP